MRRGIGSRGDMGVFAKDFAEIAFIGISAHLGDFLNRMAAFEKQFLATATIPEYEETEEDW